MSYIAVTFEGVEDVCAKEVQGKKVGPGRVLFTKEKENIQSAKTIFKLNKQVTIEEFEDVLDAFKTVNFTAKGTYKVSCSRTGNHKFRSMDVEQACGEFLHGNGHKIDVKNPLNTVYIDIINNLCSIGIRLQTNLCKRKYRVKFHNQGISCCLAFCLLQLMKCKKSDILLDPLCKDGIIPIEAARSGIKKVYALDGSKNNIRNATINSKMAKVNMEIATKEITELETFFKQDSINKLATVIILSKRDKYSFTRLRDLLYQAETIVKETIGIISNSKRVKEYITDTFTLQEQREIKVGGMMCYLFILKKVQPSR